MPQWGWPRRARGRWRMAVLHALVLALLRPPRVGANTVGAASTFAELKALLHNVRDGDENKITVVRLVIANTVEERIIKLQEKKSLIFEGTVGGDTEALGKLTEDDLKFLFG